jgi:hypothetical protein
VLPTVDTTDKQIVSGIVEIECADGNGRKPGAKARP